MDVRERIPAAMTWQEPDWVPLTIYDWMIPTGAEERELHEMDLGTITRLPAQHTTEDIPAQHCACSLRAIARTIQDLS